MNLIQSTSQFFQLSFTAILAVILGGLTAKLLPGTRSNKLKIEISLLIFFMVGLTLLLGDSILQVFWNVNSSLAVSNELVLLIRSTLTFLLIVVFSIVTLNIAKKTGWLKLITAFILVALSLSFVENPVRLPAISILQAFWLLSYFVCVVLLLLSFAVVRARHQPKRRLNPTSLVEPDNADGQGGTPLNP